MAELSVTAQAPGRPFAAPRQAPFSQQIILDYYCIRLYCNFTGYQVRIKKKVNRGLSKLPKNIRQLLFLLVEDLKADGPIQKVGITSRHWVGIGIIVIYPIAMLFAGHGNKEKLRLR